MSPTNHDTEQRVRTALQGAAEGLRLEAPDPGTVREEARRRTRRRQQLGTGLTVVAVVAGGLGVVQMLDRQPAVQFPDSAGSSQGGGLDLAWSPADDLLSQPQIVQAPDGVLYALSTAPGLTWEEVGPTSPQQAVYRSTDGASWETVATLPEDLHLATFEITGDGVLYSLTTAPGAGGGEVLRVAESTDGGAAWNAVDISAGPQPPGVADGVQLSHGLLSIDTASHEGVVVATVTARYFVVSESVLTAEEQAAGGWVEPSAEGLQVWSGSPGRVVPAPSPSDGRGGEAEPAATPAGEPYATEGEPTAGRVIPWADLGLAGAHDLVVSQTLVGSTSGGFTPASLPAGGRAVALLATAGGFTAVLHDQQLGEALPVQIATSPDGVTWTLQDTSPGNLISVDAAGVIGDTLVILGPYPMSVSREGTTVAYASADGGATWTTTGLRSLLQPGPNQVLGFGPLDVGALGAGVGYHVYEAETGSPIDGGMLVTADGVTWQRIPIEEINPDGQGVGWLSIDANRIIALTYGEDGESRALVGVPGA